jgi:hypothetical protein
LRLARPAPPALAYHVARIVAYTLLGAVLGALGDRALPALARVSPILPWLMAGAFVAMAFAPRRVAPASGVARALAVVTRPLARACARFSPVVRAGALGAATPLLPCGLLHGVALVALAAVSPTGGAAVMGAFALGATPALAFVQTHALLLTRHPRLAAVARRSVPVVAAVVLVWRALATGDVGAPPACH